MKIIIMLMLIVSCSAHAVQTDPERALTGNEKIIRTELKRVPVQPYLANLEATIKKDTQWVVFEQNNEALWKKVQAAVSDRLIQEWRAGRLLGSQTEHAFFVICNRTTMTQTDIDNGRLICQIGVAPSKPAEFNVFQLQHTTAAATDKKQNLKPIR